jgi:phosphatidate cytidylyltransferase
VTQTPPVERRSFSWRNFAIRAASGLVLAALALGSVWLFEKGGLARAPFLALMCIGGVLLAIEWSAMATPKSRSRSTIAVAFAVILVILFAFVGRFVEAWIAMAAGAVAAAVAAKVGGDLARDGAYGVFYIAPACLVLMWLIESPQGSGWTTMFFACAWSADIFAFIVGSALGGPKLWPRWSPNKTWSGFFGGLAGAVAISVGVAWFAMRLSLTGAALIGVLGGLATMAGDLWESVLKRRFGVKDAGSLIPGHGGLLDRVDGMMFAVMIFAAARLIVQVGWNH